MLASFESFTYKLAITYQIWRFLDLVNFETEIILVISTFACIIGVVYRGNLELILFVQSATHTW